MALTAPAVPLDDGVIRLRPLTSGDEPGFATLIADPDVRRFTRIPDPPPEDFARTWLQRYVDAWADGSRAGFAIETVDDGGWAGWAGIVDYHPDASEAEIGYIVAPAYRGRGLATRTLRLVTEWALDAAALARLELIISVDNEPSLRTARACGYTAEGVRRSTWVKGETRADVAVFSRLPGDP